MNQNTLLDLESDNSFSAADLQKISFCCLKPIQQVGMVAHNYNPSTQEAGRS
jgi:hypothetical protein